MPVELIEALATILVNILNPELTEVLKKNAAMDLETSVKALPKDEQSYISYEEIALRLKDGDLSQIIPLNNIYKYNKQLSFIYLLLSQENLVSSVETLIKSIYGYLDDCTAKQSTPSFHDKNHVIKFHPDYKMIDGILSTMSENLDENDDLNSITVNDLLDIDLDYMKILWLQDCGLDLNSNYIDVKSYLTKSQDEIVHMCRLAYELFMFQGVDLFQLPTLVQEYGLIEIQTDCQKFEEFVFTLESWIVGAHEQYAMESNNPLRSPMNNPDIVIQNMLANLGECSKAELFNPN